MNATDKQKLDEMEDLRKSIKELLDILREDRNTTDRCN